MENRCVICDIKNVVEVNIFTENEVNVFIDNIIYGVVTVENLDLNQYLKIARKLSESVEIGFGHKLTELPSDITKRELLIDLLDNCYVFAAAKQYQLVREITALSETIEKKEDFVIEAKKIFEKYNVTYFTTELDSAEYQAKAANEWLNFVEWDNAEN